ncbi:peptidase S41-like protein [Jejuia pallidilutea]|uniref:Peptidase S41-like protein n=1 Tax=Jejuia pallidilutea TaxID=504487 RepID=A0A362X0R6_9FLAO|nr:S41 family peptidase [Jejuia pallidilutea]PQV49451.1 peptidase S41-like protein [Jejuia pallidilutea]
MTKRYQFSILIVINFLWIGAINAQSCNCSKDFNALDILLQKTPAYKDSKAAYQKIFQNLSSKLNTITSDYECLVLLNKLALAVNDNHINVFGMPESKGQHMTNTTISLDSLKQELSKRPFKDIEGVYKLPNYVTLGVYKHNQDYLGIILESELENWNSGEIMYTLIPYGEDLMLAIFGQQKNKRMVAVSERIKNGMFLKLGLRKNQDIKPYHLAPSRDSLFIRKELNDKTTYIKSGSFNSFYPVLSDAEAFYKTLENSLSKENLIVDLRDNTGGGERNSDVLLEILTQYSANNNMFVLINHNTASNAEQFAVKLKKLPNTKILGDKTQGTLTYELKKNISNPLPCGKFLGIITSKRHKEYLPFESVGVTPDMYLNYDSDWIEQAVKIINRQSKY